MSDNANEAQMWQDLIGSDGWRLLVQHEKGWWEKSLSDEIARCANEPNDAAALNKLRQIVAAKQAVDRLLTRPEERLRQLRTPERSFTMSRGGV